MAAVDAGLPLSALAAALAASPEAQGDIANLYQNELGRAPDSNGSAYSTQALANGGSLAGLSAGIANSGEARADIGSIFQAELGRPPADVDVTGLTTFLAAGGTLAAIRAAFAVSPEAQAKLAGVYQSELGRAPDSAGQAFFTQALANGASLAAITAGLAVSPEVAATVSNLYQAAVGHAPNAISLAAATSELLAGIPFATVQGEINELTGAPPPSADRAPLIVTINPTTIGGSTPSFVYSLGSNAALVSPSPSIKISAIFGGFGTAPNVTGFNPATDFIQVATQEVPNYKDLNVTFIVASSRAFFAGHADISLLGVPGTSLSPTNFHFVT